MSLILDGTAGLTFNNATTQASAGVVLQVVGATYSTFGSTTSTTYADTGITVTITPKFATSKILILVDISGVKKAAFDSAGGFKMQRNSSDLWNINDFVCWNGAAQGNSTHIGAMYLDSPASSSALTYKIQYKTFSASCAFAFNESNTTALSTITVMEIAA
jgi:hypothetical protein